MSDCQSGATTRAVPLSLLFRREIRTARRAPIADGVASLLLFAVARSTWCATSWW